ncbi:tol-pal system protein YbgF [Hyphomicrobium sp.]|uniref:tol-pal system protein YbgF n=1 Tax=Hyphomicrobium sp. TaxID=82 RepID=UPI003F72AD02
MQSTQPVVRRPSGWSAVGLALALVMGAGPALAQSFESEQLPAVKGAKAPSQKAAPNAGAGAAAGAGAGGGGGDSAGLRQRVEQLEGQLVDLQVVIGTLESLARTGGAQPAPLRTEQGGGSMSAGDSVRLDSIETQIRALTAQVEQLSSEMRAQGAGGQRRSDAAGPPSQEFADDGTQTSRFGSTTVTSDNNGFEQREPGQREQGQREPGPGAGSAPGGSRFPPVASQQPAAPSTYGAESLPPPPGGGDQFAAADPMGGGSAKEVYENAYGHLLQQDYGAAQTGFRDFLKNYPKDPLAPNALYWLGESHYVQRNFADAAEAFDLVIQAYGTSGKAPDAQLKRGMALAQLGKRQDACASLRAVTTKYPNAPPLLKSKADGERQRIGCP